LIRLYRNRDRRR